MVSCVLASCTQLSVHCPFRVISVEFLPKNICHIKETSNSTGVEHLATGARSYRPSKNKLKKKTGIQPVCTDVVKGTHMLPKGTIGEETDVFKGEGR